MKAFNRSGTTSVSLFSNIVIWTIVLGGFILALPKPISAQDIRGRVSGFVTDPSNAAVPGAKVTLTNVNTGILTVRESEPNGHYLFDLVQPGNYSVSVELTGFEKFASQTFVLDARGDVTVNATLKVGAVTEKVTVTGHADLVPSTTSSIDTTVERRSVEDMPIMAHNPFTLALLDASVTNNYWDTAHRTPWYTGAETGMNLGGDTSYANNLTMDGAPLTNGGYGGYTAPMDAVQEVNIAMNAVDAEYGFSAGGAMNVTTKSGTNQIHGSVYYFGINSAMNALASRQTRTPNIINQSAWGGSFGAPIVKNKLFSFTSYEQWVTHQPDMVEDTVPTAAERKGDYSQALTPAGAFRPIYDPTTTQFDPVTGTVTRTAFPGNKIPANRIDPTGQIILDTLWQPNGLGTDPSGANNYIKGFYWWTHYYNFSERIDYTPSDKWRMFGRFSYFRSKMDNPNWGGTIGVPSSNGGQMNAGNDMADLLYVASPSTTVDFKFAYSRVEDDYFSSWAQVPQSVWGELWPNGWYKSALVPSQQLYYPSLRFGGVGTGARMGFGRRWFVHQMEVVPSVTLIHDRGIHHMKVGWQLRYMWDNDNNTYGPGNFNFNAIDTGNTFLSSYDPTLSGDQFASALLGVVNSGFTDITPNQYPRLQHWGLFFQDDIKVSRNVTLNLGLRWERQLMPADDAHHLVKDFDLTQALPALQGIAMPPQVTAIDPVPPTYTGAMEYTSASSRMWPSPWTDFLPHAGVSFRLNDKTSLRFGYARYAMPFTGKSTWGGYFPNYGYSRRTSVISPLAGVPQAYISNPFPSTNPVELPVGKTLGAYTGVGNSNSWFDQGYKTGMDDRINISLSRAVPGQILLTATFLAMYSHNLALVEATQYNYNLANPALIAEYGPLTAQSVPNPFYGLPTNIMPGALGVQPTVTVSQLMTPYPQYGDMGVYNYPGFADHYYGFTVNAQRRMAHGMMVFLSYGYNQEHSSQWFNTLDEYNNKQTWEDYSNIMGYGMPRHNLRLSGTYEFPFGRGRQFMNHAPRVVEAILGGWGMSHFLQWQSGSLLIFPQAYVSGDPSQNIPSGAYFNPSVFSYAPDFTNRINPWSYPTIRGPKYWQLDSDLSKTFSLTEKLKFDLRIEFYNLPNVYMPAIFPDMGIGSGTMGRSLYQQNYGRECQYSAKLRW